MRPITSGSRQLTKGFEKATKGIGSPEVMR
jgi:hypothetical protein